MRCYIDDCRIKVVTKGGSEFVNNVRHRIAAVYPLDDGILIKAIFNADLYAFELGGGVTHHGSNSGRDLKRKQSQESLSSHSSRDTFVYLSLLGHPLNDATPIAFEHADVQMINTAVDVLYVSASFSFVVMYDQGSNDVRFCFLKQVPDSDTASNRDVVMQSIDQDSRGARQQLPQLIGSSKVIICPLFSIEKCLRPRAVVVTAGLASNEINVCLYFAELMQVHVYTSQLGRGWTTNQFKKSGVYSNVARMLQISFTKPLLNAKTVQVTTTHLIRCLLQQQTKDSTDQSDSNLKLFQERLAYSSNDLALLSSDFQKVSIYAGAHTLVHEVRLADHFRGCLINDVTWRQSAPSTLQVALSDGKIHALEVTLSSSYMVSAVLKVLKKVLSSPVYADLVKETVALLVNQPGRVYCFDAFADLLLGLMVDQSDLKLLSKTSGNSGKDFLQRLMPQKKEETKAGQSQDKPTGSKVLRVSSATTKIKPISSATEKRVAATISMSSTGMKNSPTKYQGSSGPNKPVVSAKIQVKKISKPEVGAGSPVAKAPEFSKAVLIPNAFELMMKSEFAQSDKLFRNLIQEINAPELSTAPAEPSIDIARISRTRPVQTRSNPTKPQSSTSPQKKTASVEPANTKEMKETKKTLTMTEISDQADHIFKVLHLLYEDLKLHKLLIATEGPKLRRLLFAMALVLSNDKQAQFGDYLAYYATEDGHLSQEFAEQIKARFDGKTSFCKRTIEEVPRIMVWLQGMLCGIASQTSFPIVFSTTRIVCRLYEILTQQHKSYFLQLKEQQSGSKQLEGSASLLIHGDSSRPGRMLTSSSLKDYLMLEGSSATFGQLHLFEKVLYCLKEEMFAMDQIQQLPDLVALPFLDIIRYTKLYQSDVQTVPMWPTSLYRLIRREDIINNLSMNGMKQVDRPIAMQAADDTRRSRVGRKSFAFSRRDSNVFNEQQNETKAQKIQNRYIQELIGEDQTFGQDRAGPGHSKHEKDSVISEFLKNRFGKDTRYKEAEYLLSSSVDMVLKMDSLLTGGHADQLALNEEEKQRRQKLQLDKLFSRHLSKCIGRGALTLGTQETLPTETLSIPKISQQGIVTNSGDQGNQTEHGTAVSVTLEARDQREVLQWPTFHNGVATALKISQMGFKRSLSTSAESTNTSNMNHARDWIMFHKPQEPKNEHGGFLLGIGLLGQLDSLRPTDLYQHLKSAHDSTTIGILLGRAVSQIGKMDDADSRTMCLHIPSLLPQNLSVEISLTVQSAAVIGAGLLYQGTANRLITEMLLSQIARKPSSDKMIEREGYALASGIALGLVNLAKNPDQASRSPVQPAATRDGAQNPFNQANFEMQFNELNDLMLDERLIRFIEGGKKMPLPRSMMQTTQNQDMAAKSSAVKENDMVNVYVTSAGALFALTLIHLKTNNKTVAERLTLPDTFYQMEFVRPVALMQKVLARNLIMWDEIQPSEEWLIGNVPTLIRQIYESDMETIDKEFNKRCSTKEIDFATVALCYVNILAGAASSVGFKYAGTGNVQAKQLIESQIAFFRKQLKTVPGTQPLGGPIKTNTTAQTKNQVDKSTVETCLCILALALGMVMAGKCDISCFRILRVLRKRFEGEMHYGYNMAINMAIGFLFLGSGAYTFSRTNEAIAALLCATYPIFPSNPGDNRFHLQALRHFYVLSIETRLLQARDIDTGAFVNIEVVVTLEDDANQQVKQIVHQTPDIINGKILSIQVKDNADYHDVTLKIADHVDDGAMQIDQLSKDMFAKGNQSRFEQTALQRVIYVKRKNLVEKQEHATASLSSELVTALRNKDIFNESVILQMAKKAQSALLSLQHTKDRSVEEFMAHFASTLFVPNCTDKRKQVQSLNDLTLDQTLASIQEVLLANQGDTVAFETFALTNTITKSLEVHLYEESVARTYQSHYITLLVLNECMTDDKVSSLPLLLRLSQTVEPSTVHYLKSYIQFMRNCKQRGLFGRSSNNIISKALIDAVDCPRLEADVRYVATLGEAILTHPEYTAFAKFFGPYRLQSLSAFLLQVLQHAEGIYGHQRIDRYLRLMQSATALDAQSAEVNQLMMEAISHAIKQIDCLWTGDNQQEINGLLKGLIMTQ